MLPGEGRFEDQILIDAGSSERCSWAPDSTKRIDHSDRLHALNLRYGNQGTDSCGSSGFHCSTGGLQLLSHSLLSIATGRVAPKNRRLAARRCSQGMFSPWRFHGVTGKYTRKRAECIPMDRNHYETIHPTLRDVTSPWLRAEF